MESKNHAYQLIKCKAYSFSVIFGLWSQYKCDYSEHDKNSVLVEKKIKKSSPSAFGALPLDGEKLQQQSSLE